MDVNGRESNSRHRALDAFRIGSRFTSIDPEYPDVRILSDVDLEAAAKEGKERASAQSDTGPRSEL